MGKIADKVKAKMFVKRKTPLLPEDKIPLLSDDRIKAGQYRGVEEILLSRGIHFNHDQLVELGRAMSQLFRATHNKWPPQMLYKNIRVRAYRPEDEAMLDELLQRFNFEEDLTEPVRRVKQ